MQERKSENLFEEVSFCEECGICCQGIFYSKAMLGVDELNMAQELNLQVDAVEQGFAFHLPCPQYSLNGCMTYRRRPRACALFQCELLSRFRNGDIIVEQAFLLITQIKLLIGQAKLKLDSDIGRFFWSAHSGKRDIP